MATSFGALCDDFYINQKLALKMDLPTGRETVLDLFDRVRKARPSMDRFRRFEGELALESATKDNRYEWLALRQTSIRSGAVNPESLANAYGLHRLVLELTPFYLSISPLDVDYLELMFGFDLEAQGNHDDIVYDALLADSPFGKLVDSDRAIATDVQPFFTFALDESRKVQVNFEVKTRSPEAGGEGFDEHDHDHEGGGAGGSGSRGGAGEGGDEPISVFLSLRQMGPIDDVAELPAIFKRLVSTAERLATERVIPHLLTPIARAINSRSR